MTDTPQSSGALPRARQHARFRSNRASEPALIRAWQEQKDSRALERLIINYKPLFGRQIANIMAGGAVGPSHRDDLEQECRLVFVQAVEDYDPSLGVTLAAFAISKIRPTLLQYALEYRTIYRMTGGSSFRKAYYAAQRVRGTVADAQKSLTDEQVEQIAKDTNTRLKEAKLAVTTAEGGFTSLDEEHAALVEERHGDELLTDSIRQRALSQVRAFLATIDERDREILDRMLIRDPDITAREVAEDYSLTKERIIQIKNKELANLRNHLEEAGIHFEDIC